MVYEIATLPVRPERTDSFGNAFAEVAPLLSRAKAEHPQPLAAPA